MKVQRRYTAFFFPTANPGCVAKQNSDVYDTGSSQAVPHPSTIPARQCLTSVIERERVFHCGMTVDKCLMNVC